jgi:ribonuclease P protein component
MTPAERGDGAGKPDERLRPAERLKKRSEFQAVLAEGRRSAGRYMVLVVRSNREAFARLGIVVSKRLGSAVERNRAKRLVREVFRRSKQIPAALGRDIIVIPRRELLGATLSALEHDFREALHREARRRPSDA